MLIDDAQHEMRTALLGGFMGQLVSGILWLVSAALATWSTQYWAIGVLVVGGFFIYPATLLGLRLIGHDATISKENPLSMLGLQVAFVLPPNTGAWFTAATLLFFAVLGGSLVSRESARTALA